MRERESENCATPHIKHEREIHFERLAWFPTAIRNFVCESGIVHDSVIQILETSVEDDLGDQK